MPGFPTLGGSVAGTVPDDLSTAWTFARKVAGFVKESARSLRDRSAAGNIEATEIINYADQLANWRAQLSGVATRGPALVAYAKQQIDNPSENITAEFNDMTAQIDATITLIVTTFPKDVNGNLLFKKWVGTNTGQTVDSQFTPADLASLRTQLTALLAALN